MSQLIYIETSIPSFNCEKLPAALRLRTKPLGFVGEEACRAGICEVF